MNQQELDKIINGIREGEEYSRLLPKKINDATLVPYLQSLVVKEKNIEVKEFLYTLLGIGAVSLNNTSIVEFLAEQLEHESNRYVLESLLQCLNQQVSIKNSTSLINFVRDKRSEIRHEAILALGKCSPKEVEDILIEVITSSNDQYDLVYACASLRQIGTMKVIPYLTKLIYHDKDDVRCAAIYALNELGDVNHTPVFMEALTHRSANTKAYAMNALKRHGDERALTIVCEYVKKLVMRKRKVQMEPSPFVDAIKFLLKFSDSEEVREVLRFIQKKENNLLTSEKHWLYKKVLDKINLG
ncbi:HEAT repeat domain-containing protein [Bacillus sp. S2(2024)]|uniref:HEAT repeat domain-containing protein n=1 Tax=Bacillus sp. S2(2024) TaxID=3162887 RepID=UPI003D216E79